jgi:hypothetical protein
LGAKSADEKAACLQSVANLSSECVKFRHRLSQYDRQIYSEDLQRLNDRVHGIAIGKQKFSFTSKPIPLPNIQPVDKSTPLNALSDPNETRLSNISERFISDVSIDFHGPIINISNINKSIVNIKTIVGSAKISNVTNSIIFVQQIEGPVYIDDVKTSALIISCHQFRMHNSTDCQIYLGCQSKRPIIEKCCRLHFGQYPNQLVRFIYLFNLRGSSRKKAQIIRTRTYQGLELSLSLHLASS